MADSDNTVDIDLPDDVATDIDQFALHLIESDELPADVRRITTGKWAGEQGLKVIATDGHESTVHEVVKQLADDFFGIDNYTSGRYEDGTVARITIVPPTADER